MQAHYNPMDLQTRRNVVGGLPEMAEEVKKGKFGFNNGKGFRSYVLKRL